MTKLKKDRVFLLKEIQSLVKTELERSEDRRNSRRLKIIRKQLDNWITELKEAKEESKKEARKENYVVTPSTNS